jgi:hypothetical protein
VRSAQDCLVTKIGRSLSAVVISAIGFTALTVSSANATSSARLSCFARVLLHPQSYNFVIVNVLTKPQAEVTATETSPNRSWSMTPSLANASGDARLMQKVAVVAKVELVDVDVHVALNGSVATCSTHYTPPSLSARM